MTPIGRQEILGLIPHAGEMCLLDEILSWDARFLRARSARFAAATNPLRRADGTLGSASAIEAAGQAMAAHGGLIAERKNTQGLLVGLRDVEFAASLLPPCELRIEVERCMGDAAGAGYRFLVTGEGARLLQGRATLRFSAVP